MYNPNDHRLPHLPRQVPNTGARDSFVLPIPGIVRVVGGKSARLEVESERWGYFRGVRQVHLVLSRTSGSVKFPIRPKADRNGRNETELAHAVIVALEGRPESAVALGFIDAEGNNELLARVTAYMKEHPDHEFPWLDVHPAGQEVVQDGFGSYSVKTKSGTVVRVVEEEGKERVEIMSPHRVDIISSSPVRIQSEQSVEILAAGSVSVSAKEATVNASEKVSVISSGACEVIAAGDVDIASSADVNISAANQVSIAAGDVEIGVGQARRICNELIREAFDTHTHASNGAPPSVPLQDVVFTEAMKAS